ncbi:hypothetical protein LTR91_025070 [Friedmanniomyces endolithicus]|uniref:Uncharacterized protein n=1 Tax=Friedmanniomyces endolithicus TaxID=329885 RepID=A0AAN6H0L3_9PEZI|nr:hypothetical protein LTR57_019754 [Friedmanniomyces endolithicus]KAK0951311.1 hypothetical protein LTR91_025070 [Friedmanniomyces endolithicus]KAK1021701.1 hypothetical protein LTS16_026314 [Friedmanniomyces endolithicus]
MIAVVANGGGLGQIGVYHAQNATPRAPRANTTVASVPFPISDFWLKELNLRGGIVYPKRLASALSREIQAGASPSFIKSAIIGIEDAPEFYRRFDEKKEIKVFIHFP